MARLGKTCLIRDESGEMNASIVLACCDGRGRIWICVFVFIIVHARLDPFRAEQEQIHFFAVFLSFGKYHVMWWIM